MNFSFNELSVYILGFSSSLSLHFLFRFISGGWCLQKVMFGGFSVFWSLNRDTLLELELISGVIHGCILDHVIIQMLMVCRDLEDFLLFLNPFFYIILSLFTPRRCDTTLGLSLRPQIRSFRFLLLLSILHRVVEQAI